MSALDFMHGSSFANALNSVVNNHREELDFEYRKKVFDLVGELNNAIRERNASIEEQNEVIERLDLNLTAGLGFIRLLEEEIHNLRAGVVSENRLSGNDQLRKNIRSELQNLAQKVDIDLARTGGVCEFLCKRGFKSHLRNPFLELDSKTSQRCFPIPNRHRPFLADIA